MRVLDSTIDLHRFRDRLAVASERVLMLDYDGTIAPFHINRRMAVPYTGFPRLLAMLARRDGVRLVIVTGRSIIDIMPLLDISPLPEIWGSHGMEHRSVGGRFSIRRPTRSVREGIRAATTWAKTHNLMAHLEQKPFGVAFHWRGLESAEREQMAASIQREWEKESACYGLILTPFDGGMELRAAGINKGQVVCDVISSSHPEAARAYLGDDLTDEDAFTAIKGRGLAVLVRTEMRLTAADIWLTPPQELKDFFECWLAPERHVPVWLAVNNGKSKMSL